MPKLLRQLEMEDQSVYSLFRLLDVDRNSEVAIDELISGMARSREAVDVITLLYENRRLPSRMMRFQDDIEFQLESLKPTGT